MPSLDLTPARIDRILYAPDGITQLAPSIGSPPALATTFDSMLAVALTATGTTVTIAHVGDIGIPGATITGATARINYAGGSGLAEIVFLQVWARRKPGATGAISAQKCLIKSWDGAALAEIGRIYIGAVASGSSEPSTDVAPIIRNPADSLISFDIAHPLNLVLDSVDANLEICLEAWGNY